jgi:hypothetical protein
VKIKRKTFEPTVDQKANPGPGNYDYEVQNPKNFNSNVNYSIFQSKVPNCKDAKIKNDKPGPGAYKTVISIEKQNEDKLIQSNEGQYIG